MRQMVRAFVLGILVLLGAGCVEGSIGTIVEPTRVEGATVVRVVDGDTVVLAIGGAQEKVRLIGMDTPERGEPLGPRATAFVRRLLPVGTAVSYETDVRLRDRYDRLLAYVWIGASSDRRPEAMLNARIVAAGWARILTIPPDVRFADLFLRLQRQARAAKRGMWAIEPFTPTTSPPG